VITRDSWIWLLGFLAATVGYLITAHKPPTEWSYMEWLQAASFVLAYLVGRMSASPLAGDATKLAETKPAVFGLFSVKE
jgi:hypothetical protein